jgi:hypothetical protein
MGEAGMMRWGLAAILVAVAACASAPQTYRDLERRGAEYERAGSSPLAGRSDECHASQFQTLVGVEQNAVDRASLPANSRVICYRCNVTLDLRQDRLNVEIGADGKVARVYCG